MAADQVTPVNTVTRVFILGAGGLSICRLSSKLVCRNLGIRPEFIDRKFEDWLFRIGPDITLTAFGQLSRSARGQLF